MFIHTDIPTLPNLTDKTLPTGRTYITPDGAKYPSITTILSSKPKPEIENWRKMLGPEKADKETKRCADRGTAVHELIEKYLNNEEDFTRGYRPEFIKGFNQLKLRLNRINNIRAQEIALYSDRLKVAGRVDCIAEYDGVLAIVDFKTSNNNKDKDKIQDYYKQCTFYALAWFELTGEPIEDIIILMNVEKGMVPLVFKEKISNWVAPLLKDIDEYYQKRNK